MKYLQPKLFNPTWIDLLMHVVKIGRDERRRQFLLFSWFYTRAHITFLLLEWPTISIGRAWKRRRKLLWQLMTLANGSTMRQWNPMDHCSPFPFPPKFGQTLRGILLRDSQNWWSSGSFSYLASNLLWWCFHKVPWKKSFNMVCSSVPIEQSLVG